MRKLLIIVLMMADRSVEAISVVYNFRIAQITKQSLADDSNRKNTFVSLLFDQYQKKYNGARQNFFGGFASYIYDFKPYYLRVDGAVSSIHEKKNDLTTFSGANTDDILFTLGRNFKVNDNSLMTFSGLFGIPTHRVESLRHPDFGYGLVGAGVQVDGCYTLDTDLNAAFLYGARAIYFAPRNGQSHLLRYRFTMGNIADILLAAKNYWQQHGLEIGYTARTSFGAQVCPDIESLSAKTNYVRSNFYVVYKYKFLHKNTANRFLVNISYGFDHRSKRFGNKCIMTLWTSWIVNF